MQIILTVDVPDHLDRPGIPVAQALRDVADVIETAIPLDPRVVYDRYGVKLCEWKLAEPVNG